VAEGEQHPRWKPRRDEYEEITSCRDRSAFVLRVSELADDKPVERNKTLGQIESRIVCLPRVNNLAKLSGQTLGFWITLRLSKSEVLQPGWEALPLR